MAQATPNIVTDGIPSTARPRPRPQPSTDSLSTLQVPPPPYVAQPDGTMPSSSQTLRRAPVSVAIDPVGLVVSECITVTSAMRKHARWAHSSVSAILGGGGGGGAAAGGGRGAAADMMLPMSPVSPIPRGAGGAVTGGRRAGAGADNGAAAGGNRIRVGADEEALQSRWGLRGRKGKSLQDNPLMSAFARLRSELKGCKDIRQYDTPSLLHPFLQVIRSSSTSAPITSLAVIAITKFLSYSIIGRESPRLPLAMQLLSSAITHCRFEASDAATDEVVLLRILKLMEGMIAGPGGALLSDESICEMMECGLSMCCQTRLSELLRRSAEMAMVNMCQVIFERLKHLEVEAGDEPSALEESAKDDMDAVKMEPSLNGSSLAVPGGGPGGDSRPGSFEKSREAPTEEAVEKRQAGATSASSSLNGSQLDVSAPNAEETEHAASDDGDDQPPIKPYSLPSIRELFRVLVSLLDPHDRQHNDTMRVMALRIVDVALEVAGPSIANHPSLAYLAKDTLCRHLFQLVRSENMAILSESLRVAGTLLETCRGVLKLQQELFLSYLVACLFPRVEIPQEPGIEPSLYEGVPQAPSIVKPVPSQASSGRSTPVPVKDRQRLGLEGGARKPDAREAMVENVGALVRMPSFMAELFVNYDCEIDRSDLCTDVVGLLARNAFPDSATWSTTNVPPLCLDALLSYVQNMADRLDEGPVTEGLPSIARLREQRERKKVIVRGVAHFNDKPKGGVAFLASHGIIDDPDDPVSVARFLRGTTRLDKKVLGEFISKRGNEDILKAFMSLFDFSGQRIDEALRKLLNSFRLPGEAPLIERIVTNFAEHYCAQDVPAGIAERDAAYVLTYACIMLNTDQHNQNIKGQRRMTFEDFARNLRGTNGKDRGDFTADYLRDIYDSIKTREIILAEEHDNRHAYDYAWQELLLKIQSEPDLAICHTNAYDADVFAATWRPVVATLAFVFLSATDDAVFSRVVTGFHQCAQLAARHGLSDALDRIVHCLSHISTLAAETPPNTALNTEVQADDHKSVMVSETAVRFGRDDRAQLATVVLFGVVTGNEATVRDGWTLLVRIMLNLFVNSLIPAGFSSIAAPAIRLPPIPLQSPAQVIDRGDRPADTGLFSAFTSYVTSFATDEPPEPSDQEIESTLCAVDCINACTLDALFANIARMPVDALRALLVPLLAHVPQDASPRVIVVKPELPASSPPSAAHARQNGGGGARGGGGGKQAGKQAGKQLRAAYDPTLVFVLELATVLAMRDAETVAHLGKDVADALQTVVRNAANVHGVIVSRAVYYLLSLLRASNDHDFIRAPVILHELSLFPADQLKDLAPHLLRGLRDCVAGPTALRNEMANSPDFWSLLSGLHAAPDVAADVFAVVEELVDAARPPGVSAHNYEAAVVLLNEFATEGKVGAQEEQRRDREGGAKGAAKGKGGKAQPDSTNETVVRGTRAVAIIYQLTSRVPHFIERSHLEPTEAWNAYWSPIFRALTNQSLNPCRAIRSAALSSLQRALLSPHLLPSASSSTPSRTPDATPPTNGAAAAAPTAEWTATIFGEVLLPLVTRLLKPELFQQDPRGMPATRVHAATLLCRVFLHYLAPLAADGPAPLLALWTRILDVMDRLMHSGQPGDALQEAVPESLKNILLVMADAGLLVPPGREGVERDPTAAALWTETRRRLDRFLPGLFDELFAEQQSQQSQQPQQSHGSGAQQGNGGARKSVESARSASSPAAEEQATTSAERAAELPERGSREAREGDVD